MNIVELFDDRARQLAHQPALIDATGRQDLSVSFIALRQASMTIAHTLQRDGIQAGARVVVAVPVSVMLYASLLAIWRLGAVAVLPDPGSSREQLQYCCDLTSPEAFVGIKKAHLLRLLSPAVRCIPSHYCTNGWLPLTRRLSMRASNANLPPTETLPETPALITFTSGSTGRPKAASRSHGFLIAQYSTVLRTLALEPGQVDVTTLPVFVLANLAAGVVTLLPPGNLRKPGTIEAAPILDAMRRHRVNRASGSPAFFMQLIKGLDPIAELPLLDTLHTGGAPVSPELMDQLAILTVPGGVCAVYGSTEAEPIAELPAATLTTRQRQGPKGGLGLPAGLPVADIQLRVIQDHTGQTLGELSQATFEKIVQPPGKAGEIVVSAEHVLTGYLNSEGDAETKFSIGNQRWHRTGDAGYLDEFGCLWLLGRTSSAVHIDGKRVYPFQLEYPAMAHPAVDLAALLNLATGPMLVIQSPDGTDLDITPVLAVLPFSFPTERVQVVREIPLDRRHNAKIDYGKLRSLFAPEV